MSQLHIVFGAGQVGSRLAHALVARGHRVRVVRRSSAPVGPGIEVVAADATHADAVRQAARGADVIYHCMNPSAYTQEAWEAEFPKMGEALISAAMAEGARLVCLDNVYGYGPMDSARREHSPMKAEGPKGRVRIRWSERLHAAGAEGLRWTAGRGGDFWGPGTSSQSLMSMETIEGLGRGRPALLLGDTRAEHSFSFVPDVVAGLVALGAADRDVEGRAWHLPVHTVAPRELALALARAQGRRGWTVGLPGWLVRALAPVVPLFEMLRETLYQWEGPFYIDDSAFRTRFPGIATPLDQAVQIAAAGIAGESSESAFMLRQDAS